MLRPLLLVVALAVVLAGCGDRSPPAAPPVRLVHTFNPAETAALDDYLADRGAPVATVLLPFARGQSVLHEVLRSGEDCPDVARIDATWLPGLVDADLLHPAPDALIAARTWLPEAIELARHAGTTWALPHSIDGLAVVYRPDAVAPLGGAWPARTLGDLEAAARRLTRAPTWGLGLRVDGYWFVAFLRDAGADVADGTTGALGVDGDAAVAAAERFAGLFGVGGVSPPPPPPGSEAQIEARRFRAGDLAALVTGPWALPELSPEAAPAAMPGAASARLSDDLAIGVAPLPGAPRGGQLLVVPRCAGDPEGGWRLAAELTDPRLAGAWSRRTGMIPATADGLAAASEVSREFHAALAGARPLPRHPMSAWVFDDLNPALAAVVAGDASADEAIAGVRRGWARLLRQELAP